MVLAADFGMANFRTNLGSPGNQSSSVSFLSFLAALGSGLSYKNQRTLNQWRLGGFFSTKIAQEYLHFECQRKEPTTSQMMNSAQHQYNLFESIHLNCSMAKATVL